MSFWIGSYQRSDPATLNKWKKIQFNPGPLTISQSSPKDVIIIYETNEDKSGKES